MKDRNNANEIRDDEIGYLAHEHGSFCLNHFSGCFTLL